MCLKKMFHVLKAVPCFKSCSLSVFAYLPIDYLPIRLPAAPGGRAPGPAQGTLGE